MATRTQQALYATIDLELSWSEEALPQAERTKHVHALHPYLGKFVPQLVETFLRRHFEPGQCVFDPFVGSGTTLVEANVHGLAAVGYDVSAFNCLLTRVKTRAYEHAKLELALRTVLEAARRSGPADPAGGSAWARRWFAPLSLGELLAYRAAAERLDERERDVAHVVLSRAARSARLTTHFDLDFPKRPCRGPYHCRKHGRTCRPVQEAAKFLRRYTDDTIARLRAFAGLRTACPVEVVHGDARTLALPTGLDGVVTSPPYPGLIDYHEQHRYAYELLDLADLSELEIGAARGGRTRRALAAYVEGIAGVLGSARRALPRGAPVIVVVNDARDLYPAILARAGLDLETRLTRHVNRRTGLRAGEFFEDVLVCRA